MFIRLLNVCKLVSFSRSLASNSQEPINCITLKNQPFQAGPTLADINSNETYFIHSRFMLISVAEVVTLLIIQYRCEVRNINVKLFSLKLVENKSIFLVQHQLLDCKRRLNKSVSNLKRKSNHDEFLFLPG